jgi:putative nucleotidyltransferase with HDIG domain
MSGEIISVNIDVQRRRKHIIQRLEALPPLPAAAQEVLTVVAGDPANISRLEQIIMHDPGLSAMLLKVANSPAYYPQTPVTTVHRAIVLLGFSEVKNIALSLSISGMFKNRKSSTGFDRQGFWNHSIATAMIARIIAMEAGEEEQDLFFTAGLLHDIGRVALELCFEEEFRGIIARAEETGSCLLKAEREAQLPHNLIGYWLARGWELPEIFSEIILTHHLPVRHKKMTRQGALVQLADQIAHHMDIGVFPSPPAKRATLANYIGLGAVQLALLEEQLEQIGMLTETITDSLE